MALSEENAVWFFYAIHAFVSICTQKDQTPSPQS